MRGVASGSRLVVLGDTLLDCDVEGTVDRLCPDAPVPVVDLRTRRHRPGGAGLAALLAARTSRTGRAGRNRQTGQNNQTGREVVLVTALGSDPAAELLADLIAAYAEVVQMPLCGSTVCKTRIRSGGRSLLRVDSGDGRAVGGPDERRLREALHGAGAVLVSDYGGGVTADPMLRAMLAELACRIPVVWDPHPRGAQPVPGCRLATPNEAEATRAVCATATGPAGDARMAAAPVLRTRWRCDAVAMTCGAHGAVLATADGCEVVPLPDAAVPPEWDTCGAGDAFAAAAACALLDQSSVRDAVIAAVGAASCFVADGAAAAVTAVPASPVGRSALDTALQVRRRGGRLVATGGCFDLLHPGHLALLQRARALGDALVVLVNSDASVRRRKGPGRPLVPAVDRIALLQALEPVDAVAVFDEDTPIELLDTLRPEVWVKGGDYAVADLPEAALINRYGGEIVIVPFVDGYSTSRIVSAARADLDRDRRQA